MKNQKVTELNEIDENMILERRGCLFLVLLLQEQNVFLTIYISNSSQYSVNVLGKMREIGTLWWDRLPVLVWKGVQSLDYLFIKGNFWDFLGKGRITCQTNEKSRKMTFISICSYNREILENTLFQSCCHASELTKQLIPLVCETAWL